MRTISRREGAADVVGVDVDLGLARGAVKIVEADLTSAGVAAGAISLVAEDAGVMVALGAVFATEAAAIIASVALLIARQGDQGES